MNDTTATVHAEILEEAKSKIERDINIARTLRDQYTEDSVMWDSWDGVVDRLLAEKDSLNKSVLVGELHNADNPQSTCHCGKPMAYGDMQCAMCEDDSEDERDWKAQVAELREG